MSSLFIFIKTLVLALTHCKNPEESLEAALQDSARTGLDPLYELYSSILKDPIVHDNAKFQQMVGVLLAASPYCALCKEMIAELVGVKPYLVSTWVDVLSSLLYQDEAANRGIRVWHLLVYNFFLSKSYKYQVNI